MVSVSKMYSQNVEKMLKEVERILMGEASYSYSVEIVIKMGVEDVPKISYKITEKAVI